MDLTPKKYKIVDVLNRGESYHVDIPDRKIEFVTLGLREEDNTDLLKQGNTDPFLVITGRTRSGQAVIDKVKEAIDENGKFDSSKLEGQDKVKGLFGRWPAPLHWQTSRDEDGNTYIRKYRKGHPDEGYRMPSTSVTMFIWENDLADEETVRYIVSSSIPAKALVKGDEEEVHYQYQSPFAAEVMKKVKANKGQQDTEGSKSPSSQESSDKGDLI